MKRQFLMTYFGTNTEILEFAQSLIESGNRPAAKALNKASTLFGNNIDAERVINQIKHDFDLLPKQKPATSATASIKESSDFCEEASIKDSSNDNSVVISLTLAGFLLIALSSFNSALGVLEGLGISLLLCIPVYLIYIFIKGFFSGLRD